MTPAALPETCDAEPRALAWIRPGQVGYVGPDLGADLHAASVAVLTVGLDAPFTVQTGSRGSIITRSFYAPARIPHRVVAPAGGRILLLFNDSADAPADRLAASMRRRLGPYGLDHAREAALIEACADGGDPGELRALLASASDPTSASGERWMHRHTDGRTDRRIERLVAEIRADPAQPRRAAQSAQALGLDRSHFLHLFARQTGTSFRRYRQWCRVLHVVRGITAGHDLTRCAADAGFSSPSHLSDTFRQALGTTATTVFHSGVRFDLED
ncbi:helix-turn-helix transcriptional regulator [Actinospica durhamensis]|uniref:Helix-turn-helix transcriptional regulator n=1 Tax=Actinospica durhamensis TaxID=1508375 RepID=A0A941ERW4_9ACTN|nr:AraC family transcriptional regulator [Actinospica durhamensis]MBR7835357.1 helix-turn-helix transcriptional regulator [Actinospica durhamensis]